MYLWRITFVCYSMRRLLSLSLLVLLWYSANAQRNIGSFSSITETKAFGGKVFFTASTYDFGAELYVSDGTEGNYQLVSDISPGSGSSTPKQFTVLNDELYFVAYSPKWGHSVWKTDGTAAGTQVVYNVPHAEPYNLIAFKDKLYFTTYLGSIYKPTGRRRTHEAFFRQNLPMDE